MLPQPVGPQPPELAIVEGIEDFRLYSARDKHCLSLGFPKPTKAFSGSVQARSHSTDRRVQGFGDFLVAQGVKFAEDQHRGQVIGHAVEHFMNGHRSLVAGPGVLVADLYF